MKDSREIRAHWTLQELNSADSHGVRGLEETLQSLDSCHGIDHMYEVRDCLNKACTLKDQISLYYFPQMIKYEQRYICTFWIT